MPVSKHSSTRTARPNLVFQPDTYRGIRLGINQLADVIKPTLGPISRHIVSEQNNRNTHPEILDNGAIIARRIIELSDADADTGAMLLRQMLWQLHERIGDGSATSAVIFRSVFEEGVRCITAGGNAQQLRRHLLSGMQLVLEHIQSVTQKIEERQILEKFVRSVALDKELSDILIEIFDTMGSFAHIELRNGHTQDITREYVQGILWDGGVHSRTMIFDTTIQKTELDYSAIFISDYEIDDPKQIISIVDVASLSYKALVIVAKSVSDKATGIVTYINQQPKPFKLIIVKLPDDRVQQHYMLEDLAMTTGGQIFSDIAGNKLANLSIDDFGRAKKIWANRDYFCIEEPSQDIDRGTHLLTLEKQYECADDEHKQRIRQRIGQLMGASATIYVGGLSDTLIQDNKRRIESHIKVIHGAYEHGIVSGAGHALLRSDNGLKQALENAESTDEIAAYRILLKAIVRPAWIILENAGHYPGVILSQLGCCHYMLDENAEVVTSDTAQVYDAANVVCSSFESAVRTAALALTIDVIVRHRNPEFSAAP